MALASRGLGGIIWLDYVSANAKNVARNFWLESKWICARSAVVRIGVIPICRLLGNFTTSTASYQAPANLFVIKGKWFWKDKNGLENGPFDTMGKARKDACLALC